MRSVEILTLSKAKYLGGDDETLRSAINTMADFIVERFNPQRIMLFGSQARGMTDYHSDVDLLVVMDNNTETHGTAVEIRRVLRDLHMAKDIVVTTPERISLHGDVCGNVLYYALREGVTLYERDGKPTDEALRWARYAEHDIAYLNGGKRTTPYTACWLSHQAALNMIKAALVLDGAAVPFTHDLDALRDTLPAGWPIRDARVDLARLTKLAACYARSIRSGLAQKPTGDDERFARSAANAVCDAIRAEFGRRGVPQP